MKQVRAEIIVTGLVQGVGFRYFVLRKAQELGVTGYTKNLYDGSVYNVVEGEKYLIEELIKNLRTGSLNAHVKNVSVKWSEVKNEFNDFEIRY